MHKHKFKDGFQNFINLFYKYGNDIESLAHFFSLLLISKQMMQRPEHFEKYWQQIAKDYRLLRDTNFTFW